MLMIKRKTFLFLLLLHESRRVPHSPRLSRVGRSSQSSQHKTRSPVLLASPYNALLRWPSRLPSVPRTSLAGNRFRLAPIFRWTIWDMSVPIAFANASA